MGKTDISRHDSISLSGFTTMGLVIALIVLAVLISISTYIYTSYINMAKVTIARSVLDDAGKTLFDYQIGNGMYPASIDFTSCVDEQGRNVFPENLCNQMKEDLYSIENYAISDKSYVLTARAKDKIHTLLTLTEGKITRQGR